MPIIDFTLDKQFWYIYSGICTYLRPYARGGGGALTLVLCTHCKRDSRSCGCRLEKRGLSQTQEPSEEGGGAVRGAFPVGAWLVQGKHSGLAIISVLATVIRVIVSGQLEMMSTGGKLQTTVIKISSSLIP